jgi:hypothetical protein
MSEAGWGDFLLMGFFGLLIGLAVGALAGWSPIPTGIMFGAVAFWAAKHDAG